MPNWKRILFTLLLIPITIVFIPVLLFVVLLGWLAMSLDTEVNKNDIKQCGD